MSHLKWKDILVEPEIWLCRVQLKKGEGTIIEAIDSVMELQSIFCFSNLVNNKYSSRKGYTKAVFYTKQPFHKNQFWSILIYQVHL